MALAKAEGVGVGLRKNPVTDLGSSCESETYYKMLVMNIALMYWNQSTSEHDPPRVVLP
jgi:hypothetical protein